MQSVFSNIAARKKLVIVLAAGLVLVVGVVWGVQRYAEYSYYEKLKQELSAEESAEEIFDDQQGLTAADTYVNDFKHVVEVAATKDGFSPNNVVVGPETKVMITGKDTSAHFLTVAPGSPAPRYFDPKIDITQDTVFQMKFAEKGTYSFYDSYNPAQALVVTVSDK